IDCTDTADGVERQSHHGCRRRVGYVTTADSERRGIKVIRAHLIILFKSRRADTGGQGMREGSIRGRFYWSSRWHCRQPGGCMAFGEREYFGDRGVRKMGEF